MGSTTFPHQSNLPVELYSLIISHLPSPRHRLDLYSLLTVCAAFSRAATRELYRRVSCLDQLTTKLFFQRLVGCDNSISDCGHAAVAELVCQLTFSLGAEIGDERTLRDPGDDGLLCCMRDAFKVLHNLKVLDIRRPEEHDTYLFAPPGHHLAWIFQQAQFSLTHLFVRFEFDYDNDFEQFIIRNCRTLQVLRLENLDTESRGVTDGLDQPFTALDCVTAPGYYIFRFFLRSRPTKIWDRDGGIIFYNNPNKDLSHVTAYKGCDHCSNHPEANQLVLRMFGSHLRFIQLYVDMKREVSTIFQHVLITST